MKGDIVLDRSGKDKGVCTSGHRVCQMEGCTGQRLAVRWPDGKLTYPCTKGMTTNKKGEWQIS